ncbi:MAG TPA: response regulator, partial [Pirellulales bacterium]|nr:response regulator [Pirellulales bacterium]
RDERSAILHLARLCPSHRRGLILGRVMYTITEDGTSRRLLCDGSVPWARRGLMFNQTIGRPMEILLVEDGLVDASVTIGALKKGQIQHRMTLIRDGAEAMEFLRQDGKFARAPRPDLILLDLGLPKKDGRQVLQEVKADETLSGIPVVIMTSSDDEEDRIQSELLGVDAFVTKPVDFEKFLTVVRQLKRYLHADLILPAL